MLYPERGLALVTEKAGGHGHRPAGIQHVDHWLAVVWCNLDGGVRPARGCPANEQRQLKPLTLHLARHVHHLVERRRDQAAESDHVRLLRLGAFEDLFAWDHYAHVDHFIVIAGKYDPDDVLANVVNVPLDRRENNLSLRLDHLARCSHRNFLGFHERSEVRHGLLHHTRRLDHLRQEHFAGSEKITHHAHTGHEWAFDN